MQDIEKEKYQWKARSIRRILKSLEYTGKAVNHRRTYIRGKEIKVDPDNWEIIDNIYPRIVSDEIYKKANTRFTEISKYGTSDIPHLKKILVGEDNKALLFKTTQVKQPVYLSRDQKCKVIAEDIHTIILNDVKEVINRYFQNEAKFIQAIKDKHQSKDYVDIDILQKQKNQIANLIATLFESKMLNLITDEDYKDKISIPNQKLKDIELLIKNQQQLTTKQQTIDYQIKEFIKLLKTSKEYNDLDLIYHLVNKIVVKFIDKTNVNIEIQYKFINQVE